MSDVTDVRDEAIRAIAAEVRRIEAELGVTREALEAIKAALIELGLQTELFPEEDFPPEGRPGGKRVYTLSIDPDKRFALYLDCCEEAVETPPHNHTTWAVVAGVRGAEHNKFYETAEAADGVERGPPVLSREVTVRPGIGVAMMPDDFHSIHFAGEGLNMNLHMYGLGLAELHERVMFDAESGGYEIFEPHPDAR